MQGCDLSYADLTNAYCWGASFVAAELDDANLSYAYFDETGDCMMGENIGYEGYDDASFDAGSQTDDVNLDGVLNILDLVVSSNMIIEN